MVLYLSFSLRSSSGREINDKSLQKYVESNINFKKEIVSATKLKKPRLPKCVYIDSFDFQPPSPVNFLGLNLSNTLA